MWCYSSVSAQTELPPTPATSSSLQDPCEAEGLWDEGRLISLLMILQAEWKDSEHPSRCTARIWDEDSVFFFHFGKGIGEGVGPSPRGSPAKTQSPHTPRDQKELS